jgi:FkbM family methyltransferase
MNMLNTNKENMRTLLKLIKPCVEKVPFIAVAYRQFRDGKDLYKQPKMTSLGFKFNGNEAMEKGEFEPIETKLVKNIFSKVDLVVNIGANIGYYVCLALHNGKKIIAFEPMEMNLKYLLRNIKSNNWEGRSEVFPIALSNSVGILELYGAGTGASLIRGWAGASEKHSTLVPCSTLDKVVGDRLSGERVFVILDVEGAENSTLEGASKLLEMNPKPVWLVEVSIDEHLPNGMKINPNLLSVFDKFWSRGYEVITADSELRKVEKNEILEIVKTQINTLKTHNFVFYEAGYSPVVMS